MKKKVNFFNSGLGTIVMFVIVLYAINLINVPSNVQATCGNNICETGENLLNCARDCTPFAVTPPEDDGEQPQDTGTCSDSDGGRNFEIAGTCTDSLGSYTDRCTPSDFSTQYIEYKCPGMSGLEREIKCQQETISCAPNSKCYQGKCWSETYDSDGDGFSDIYEWETGTDPHSFNDMTSLQCGVVAIGKGYDFNQINVRDSCQEYSELDCFRRGYDIQNYEENSNCCMWSCDRASPIYTSQTCRNLASSRGYTFSSHSVAHAPFECQVYGSKACRDIGDILTGVDFEEPNCCMFNC